MKRFVLTLRARQDVDKPCMRARNGLESRHSFEFPEKRAFAFECAAVNDLYRTKRADHSARQPNLTVSAAPNHAEQFVIGNDWNLSRNLIGNGRFYTSGTREAILGSALISDLSFP